MVLLRGIYPKRKIFKKGFLARNTSLFSNNIHLPKIDLERPLQYLVKMTSVKNPSVLKYTSNSIMPRITEGRKRTLRNYANLTYNITARADSNKALRHPKIMVNSAEEYYQKLDRMYNNRRAARKGERAKARASKITRSLKSITQQILNTGKATFSPAEIRYGDDERLGLKNLIMTITAGDERRWLIEYKGRHYTLNKKKRDSILERLSGDLTHEHYTKESDNELLDFISEDGSMTITDKDLFKKDGLEAMKESLSKGGGGGGGGGALLPMGRTATASAPYGRTSDGRKIRKVMTRTGRFSKSKKPAVNAANKGKLPTGEFFPYFISNKFLHMKTEFERYDMYFGFDKNNYQDNCLVKALIAAGIDEMLVNGLVRKFRSNEEIKLLIENMSFKQRSLNILAKLLHVNIIIKRDDSGGNWRHYPTQAYKIKKIPGKKSEGYFDNTHPTVHMRMEEGHYFIADDADGDRRMSITPYAIKHYEALKAEGTIERLPHRWFWITGLNRKSGDKYQFNPKRAMKIKGCVDLLRAEGHLLPIKNMPEIFQIQYRHSHQFKTDNYEFSDLHYSMDDIKCRVKESKDKPEPFLVFFDFETDTRGRKLTEEQIAEYDGRAYPEYDGTHDAYMCCASTTDGDKGCWTDPKQLKYTGKNLLDWLNDLMEQKQEPTECWNFHTKQKEMGYEVTLIAHNANYDIKYLQNWIHSFHDITCGTSLKTATGTYKKKSCEYRLFIKVIDSLNFMTFPLSSFGKTLQINTTKDIMPYHIYNKTYFQGEWSPRVPLQTILDTWDDELDADKMEQKKAQFTANIAEHNLQNDRGVDIIKYAEYYCKKDVEVLQVGFLKFRQLMLEATGEDMCNYYTLPSLANGLCDNRGVWEDVPEVAGLPQLFLGRCVKGGRTMTRDNQKWWITKDTVYTDATGKERKMGLISDYDLVSSYPSAMERMSLDVGGVLKGHPQTITSAAQFDIMKDCYTTELTSRPTIVSKEDSVWGMDGKKHKVFYNEIEMEEPQELSWDGFFVEVKITRVGIKRHFPLESFRGESGIKRFTNNLEFEKSKETLFLDRFAFEDLIKFQDVGYEFVRGYYFNHGRNNTIAEVIRELFDERLRHKAMVLHLNKDMEVLNKWATQAEAEAFFDQKVKKGKVEEFKLDNGEYCILKDPKESCFKLVMNIIYGRSSMRPPEFDLDYRTINYQEGLTEEEKWADVNDYLERHFNEIVSFDIMDGGGQVKFKRVKELHTHFNRAHVAAEILSMSKRLMNEIICLAEDLLIPIFYTDTDSMLIAYERLPELESAYSSLYQTERQVRYGEQSKRLGINGKDLGQVHIDFELGGCDNVFSDEILILGKKTYLARLVGRDIKTNTHGKRGHHARAKGITNKVLFMRDIDECYRTQYHNTDIDKILKPYKKFDLLATKKPKFLNQPNGTMKTLIKFERSMNFACKFVPYPEGFKGKRDKRGQPVPFPKGDINRDAHC